MEKIDRNALVNGKPYVSIQEKFKLLLKGFDGNPYIPPTYGKEQPLYYQQSFDPVDYLQLCECVIELNPQDPYVRCRHPDSWYVSYRIVETEQHWGVVVRASTLLRVWIEQYLQAELDRKVECMFGFCLTPGWKINLKEYCDNLNTQNNRPL